MHTSTPWCLSLTGAPGLAASTVAKAQPAESLHSLARKDAAWLALAAVDGPLPAARVAAWVWPASDAAGALNNLRQRVFRLRKATGARLVEIGASITLADDLGLDPVVARLIADSRLPLNGADIDSSGTGRQPDRAADESPGTEAVLSALQSELLAGFEYADCPDFDSWLGRLRLRWRELRIDRLAAAAEAAQGRGELAAALQHAQAAVHDAPLAEHLRRRVMRLHYLRGDRAAAVAEFEAFERLLRDELGLTPSAETIELLRDVERQPAASRGQRVPGPVPLGLLRPPVTVGREQLIAAVHGVWRDGRAAALVGEAGIGKSRLIAELVGQATSALTVQARPGDAMVPFGLAQRALRAFTPQASGDDVARVSSVAPRAPEPTATGVDELTRLLEARAARSLADGVPVIVAVDDLHHADSASLDALADWIVSPALAPLKWLLALRPPVEGGEVLAAFVEQLIESGRTLHIDVPPLEGAALGQLIASVGLADWADPRRIEALYRHSGGNPLFALETARADSLRRAGSRTAAPDDRAELQSAGLPRPALIAQLLDRRVARLPSAALSLARVAALAGPDFSAALAEQVLRTPILQLSDAWRELEMADVLRGSAFAHDLIHEAVLRSTPGPVAVHARRSIAEFLHARGADPARIAPHWRAGGEPARAGEAYMQAAERAIAAGRPLEHTQLRLAAAEAFGTADRWADALDARARAAMTTFHSRGVSAALAVADENVALSAAHEGAGGAYAWATRGYLLIAAGRAEEGLESARRGYDLLRPDEHDWRFAILKYLAIGYGATGRFDEGVALLEPHLARLGDMDNPLDAGQMCGVMANLQVSALRPHEALQMLDRQFAYAQRSGVLNERVATQNNQHTALLMIGDMPGALRAAQGARRDAESDLPQCAALHQQACAWEAVSLIGLGRYGEALQALEALQATIAPLPPAEPIRAAVDEALGLLWLHLGDAARARHVLASVPVSSRPPKRRPFVQLLLAQAAMLLSAARPRDAMTDEAGRLLREALALASTLHQDQAELQIRLALGEQSDDPGAHLDTARAVLARARRAGMPPLIALAARHALVALRSLVALGQAERASLSEAAEQSRQLALTTASPLLSRPGLLLTCAAAFTDLGDGSSSRGCIEQAQTEVARLAATLPDTLRRAFLRRHTENVRRLQPVC